MENSNTSFNFDRIPKFIAKLYKATNEEKYKGICWTPDGLKVHIHDRDLFVRETLPLISKTREFGTFVRMLNSYGFVKSKDIEEEDIYSNRNFRKGREDLLGLNDSLRMIRRKRSSDIRRMDGSLKEIVEYLYVQNQELYNELAGCKERIERQERGLNGLIEVLSRVFRTNVQDISRMKSDVNLHDEMDMFLDTRFNPLEQDKRRVEKQRVRRDIPELSFKPPEEVEEKEDEYDDFF